MLHTEVVRATDLGSKRLMVVLHGLGDSLEGYRWLPEAMGLPWLNYLLVNAPDSYYEGYSWYDIFGNPDPGIASSRAMLFELLDSLPTQGFVPSQTVLFGFSQGCLMALEVAVRYPSRLAGIVAISGYAHRDDELVKSFSPVARSQRVLFTHGTQDRLIPIAPVRAQVERLRAGGLDVQWREFIKDHTIAGEAELGVIRAFVTGCNEGKG